MEGYQKRVLEEREDLKLKIEKLQKFLDNSNREDVLDFNLLQTQLQVMKTYLVVLDARIENF
jgi:hypothetical protein